MVLASPSCVRLPRWLVVATSCVALSSRGRAEVPPSRFQDPGRAAVGDLVAARIDDGGPLIVRQLVAPGDPHERVESRTIYLNRSGISVTPGPNDARTNRSSLVGRPMTVPGWSASATAWAQTVGCVDQMFSELDVTVVDEDPGDLPHIEAAVGGLASDLGMEGDWGGVSPFRADCSAVEGSIVFVFTDALPPVPRVVCEVIAQEVGHSFGLDHELLPADPMTYLAFDGARAFQDQVAACGEDEPRPCGLAAVPCRARQNSVALLRERLGALDPAAPRVTITAPRDGDTVGSQVAVTARVTGTQAPSATLYVDRTPVDEVVGPSPLELRGTAEDGPRTLTVEVRDGEHVARERVRVVVDETLDGGAGCAGSSSGPALCTGGGAVAAPVQLAVLWFVVRRRRRSERSSARWSPPAREA